MIWTEVDLKDFHADSIVYKTIVDNPIAHIRRTALVIEVDGKFFEVPATPLSGRVVVKGVEHALFYEELKNHDNILKYVEIRLPYGYYIAWFAIPREPRVLYEVKVVE